MEHPHTLLAAEQLAISYVRQCRLEEAAALLEPAVQTSLMVLGKQHSDTRSRIEDLVFVYEMLEEDQKALETSALLTSDTPSDSASPPHHDEVQPLV
ncbi:hypothetical protein M408DRAFT_233366 [Serendipita vermifera MAFF 305830]|uniref:Anaphase-promoting complex subunit 5 domain-containing protein n=1 Tax=Serendipita vermifera MAFF 305830 TaxID=933852 RepID=A0A0C3AWP0_SERVB|nr:hypothetical protein M408DRAFT_233366 [Serendipita vermifera MAFF 305830]